MALKGRRAFSSLRQGAGDLQTLGDEQGTGPVTGDPGGGHGRGQGQGENTQGDKPQQLAPKPDL